MSSFIGNGFCYLSPLESGRVGYFILVGILTLPPILVKPCMEKHWNPDAGFQISDAGHRRNHRSVNNLLSVQCRSDIVGEREAEDSVVQA